MIIAARTPVKPTQILADVWFFGRTDTLLCTALLKQIPGLIVVERGLVHICLPKKGVLHHLSDAYLWTGDYFIDPYGGTWAIFRYRRDMVEWVFAGFPPLDHMKKKPLEGLELFMATSIPG